MAKPFLRPLVSLLLFILNVILVLADLPSLNIACGRNNSFNDSEGKLWVGDSEYVHTGTPGRIRDTIQAPHPSLSTLRYFETPSSDDCYIIGGVPNGSMVAVTSKFFYGNYDGRKQSPQFQVRYDTNSWKNIVADTNGTVTYSLTYTAMFEEINICFAVPFDDYVNKSFVNSIQLQVFDHLQEKAKTSGKLVAAIVVPLIVVILGVALGVIYWLKRRKHFP